jgi:hypothetical protein
MIAEAKDEAHRKQKAAEDAQKAVESDIAPLEASGESNQDAEQQTESDEVDDELLSLGDEESAEEESCAQSSRNSVVCAISWQRL